VRRRMHKECILAYKEVQGEDAKIPGKIETQIIIILSMLQCGKETFPLFHGVSLLLDIPSSLVFPARV